MNLVRLKGPVRWWIVCTFLFANLNKVGFKRVIVESIDTKQLQEKKFPHIYLLPNTKWKTNAAFDGLFGETEMLGLFLKNMLCQEKCCWYWVYSERHKWKTYTCLVCRFHCSDLEVELHVAWNGLCAEPIRTIIWFKGYFSSSIPGSTNFLQVGFPSKTLLLIFLRNISQSPVLNPGCWCFNTKSMLAEWVLDFKDISSALPFSLLSLRLWSLQPKEKVKKCVIIALYKEFVESKSKSKL